VTTTNAAAPCNVQKQVICAAFAAATALSVTACSTGGESLMASFTQQTNDTSSTLQPQRIIARPKGNIAIAPLIGPPNHVSKELTAQVGSELAKQSINMVQPASGQTNLAQPSEYTLRGYVVAASETVGVKVSYIWDITNSAGKRVHRITGENIVRSNASNDPWSAVNSELLTKMASFTAGGIAKWWPEQANLQPSNEPLLSSAAPAVPGRQKVANTMNSPSTLSGVGRKTGSVNTQTPSLFAVYVPRVKGAPGDGSTSLSGALKKQLQKSGLKLVENSAKAAHTIEGNVAIGAAQSGQQPIKIDWVVKSPVGKKLGTVSQKNKIPAGSLDGRWGATADAAASAAAQGIIRLLPKKSAARS